MRHNGDEILKAVRMLEDYFCDSTIESLRSLSEDYKREKEAYPDSNVNELAFCVDKLTDEELRYIVWNSFNDIMDKQHFVIDPFRLSEEI